MHEMARVRIALQEQHDREREAMDDLFRPCVAGDPCGHCPRCATEERGYELS